MLTNKLIILLQAKYINFNILRKNSQILDITSATCWKNQAICWIAFINVSLYEIKLRI